MPDFIKVMKITETTLHDGSRLELPVWLSKYHITYMNDDNKHGLTNIVYDKVEMQIKGSIQQMLEKFSE